jgi:hypothetical protein
MTPRTKGIWAIGATFLLTALIHLFRSFEAGNKKANWVIWAGLSWNYFAYAFDRGMLPSNYDLDDAGKHPTGPVARAFLFWGTLVIYLSFLALMAVADT